MAILICELEMSHAAHAEFNAALVATARAAFPAEPIHFLAAREHCAAVGVELARHAIDGIAFAELPAPPDGESPPGRWHRIRTVRAVCRLHRQLGCPMLLLCGFGREFHHHFALLTPRRLRGAWCGLVHRGAYLTRERNRGLRRRLMNRAIHLLTGHRRSRLVVLGPTVARHVAEHLAFRDVDLRWIYHPWIFDAAPRVRPLGGDRIDFVFAGRTAGEKGFDVFCRIADAVCPALAGSAIQPVFTLAGSLRWVPREYSSAGNVRVVDTGPRMTRRDLSARLDAASYLVMPYDAAAYGRTKASGVLLDAINHVKPVIALRSDELSHFFERFGDLGMLCDSAPELEAAIMSVVRNPPAKAYAEQQANLLAAREFLRVENQAAAFRDLWR